MPSPSQPKPKAATTELRELVTAACRSIEAAEHAPSLAELAKRAGLSTFHFHRLFKATTGLTPKAYAAALRRERLRRELTRGQSVTEAMLEAGYRSSGRFYENSKQLLGMRPHEFQAGGKAVRIRFAVGECALGSILVAQSEVGICAISLGDDPEALVHELEDRFPSADLVGGDPAFENVIASVVGFVEQPQVGCNLPLDIRGTAFQQRVWQALRRIPPGKKVSYGELARQLGCPQAVRAVAKACASNVLAVAIPCHRVVRADGALAGYRWGIERKKELLARESR